MSPFHIIFDLGPLVVATTMRIVFLFIIIYDSILKQWALTYYSFASHTALMQMNSYHLIRKISNVYSLSHEMETEKKPHPMTNSIVVSTQNE